MIHSGGNERGGWLLDDVWYVWCVFRWTLAGASLEGFKPDTLRRDFAGLKLSLWMDCWVAMLEIWHVFGVFVVEYPTCLAACVDYYTVMIMPNQAGGQLQRPGSVHLFPRKCVSSLHSKQGQVNTQASTIVQTPSCFLTKLLLMNSFGGWNP